MMRNGTTLDDELGAPAGEIPALPANFTHTAAPTAAAREVRFDLISA